jgi:thymidine kinase
MAKLYFYYSSMNAGKSTTLLQSSFNYQERGMATMLWTAAVDDRFGHGRIASRICSSRASICLPPSPPSMTRRRSPACWWTRRSS